MSDSNYLEPIQEEPNEDLTDAEVKEIEASGQSKDGTPV